MIPKTWSLEFHGIDHDKPLGFDAAKTCAAMCAEFSLGVEYHGTLPSSIKNNPVPKGAILSSVLFDG